MLSAVIAAFLYLRIIVTHVHGRRDRRRRRRPSRSASRSAAAVGLALTLAFTVVVGFLPSVVVDFARNAVTTLNL